MKQPSSQQKSLKFSSWMQSQKQQNDLCLFPRQTIQYHGNPSLCPIINAEEAEVEWFCEDLQDLLELIPQKDVLFIIGEKKIEVIQSCPTLCDPMNCSTPSLPVHHQLPEFTQIHIHRIGDAIQPSHPLSSPSPPAPNPSQHQSLFQ